ncbi:hypothetical protein ABH899_002071 [Paenibacillus sp. RC84]
MDLILFFLSGSLSDPRDGKISESDSCGNDPIPPKS